MEIYISTDIETDGPIPGDNSMLSLGAAAFNLEGILLDTFSVNFETLPNSHQNPDTMTWWNKNQEAYQATRQNTVEPAIGIEKYIKWVNSHNETPVFVGYPAGFDFLFVYWYIIHFGFESPFSFSALDIKTYAMAVLKKEYKQSTKRHMPKHWFSKKKHTHIAVDDAIEQGELFCNILKENNS